MNDVGWGTDTVPGRWDVVGSVALVVSAGVYWSSLWLASGLLPLPLVLSLAARRLIDREYSAPDASDGCMLP